jgi:hypothetical protein
VVKGKETLPAFPYLFNFSVELKNNLVIYMHIRICMFFDLIKNSNHNSFFLSIIATPGRFMHLCIEMDLKLHDVKYVVFDEADRYDSILSH